MMKTPGKIWLIGAGPGDVELLTLKAVRALGEAQVWLVDDLVNPEIAQFALPGTRIIGVGKRGGCRSTPQGFINRLMARYARQGQVVARIKGGDAMLFGRGGEEVAYLQERGLSVEVVNGLTSGVVGATRAGIPLTHRDYTRGVTFVTAHAQDHSEPDWAALAATGTTLVIYMGMSRLSSIQAGLRAAGLPAEMPAAVIERAASPDERVLVTSLGLLAREAQLGGYASPAVIVVGEVVALATVREAELRRCWARCA